VNLQEALTQARFAAAAHAFAAAAASAEMERTAPTENNEKEQKNDPELMSTQLMIVR